MSLGKAEATVTEAIDALREAAAEEPSRELSLAITNAQQSLHWLRAAIALPRGKPSDPQPFAHG
jgi:hypothetical protein